MIFVTRSESIKPSIYLFTKIHEAINIGLYCSSAFRACRYEMFEIPMILRCKGWKSRRNNAAFAKAIIYSFVGNLILPNLNDPTDSKLRRYRMNGIHGFSIVQLLNHVFQPNLPIMILEGTVDSLIKRLISTGSSWREPLDPNVRRRRRQFDTFLMSLDVIQKKDDWASGPDIRIEIKKPLLHGLRCHWYDLAGLPDCTKSSGVWSVERNGLLLRGNSPYRKSVWASGIHTQCQSHLWTILRWFWSKSSIKGMPPGKKNFVHVVDVVLVIFLTKSSYGAHFSRSCSCLNILFWFKRR